MNRRGDTLGVVMLASAAAVGVLVADHLTTPFDALFDEIGHGHGVNPNLLRAHARNESRFNPNAVSVNKNGTHDIGLMQINSHTAKSLGIPEDRLRDPRVSIEAAVRVTLENRTALEHANRATIPHLIAAYHEGPGNVIQHGIRFPDYVSRVQYDYTLYSLGRMFA